MRGWVTGTSRASSSAQHAFDIFPSLRSAGVVRGVARFLEWCHATRAERPAGLADG